MVYLAITMWLLLCIREYYLIIFVQYRMDQDNNEHWLTIKEITTRLKLHPNTVARYIQEGKLKGVKVGKGYRVRESDLLSFIGEQKDDGGARVLVVANQKGGV